MYKDFGLTWCKSSILRLSHIHNFPARLVIFHPQIWQLWQIVSDKVMIVSLPFSCSHAFVADWRLRLNNLLQSTWGTAALTWEQTQDQPKHEGFWHVEAFSTPCLSLHMYRGRVQTNKLISSPRCPIWQRKVQNCRRGQRTSCSTSVSRALLRAVPRSTSQLAAISPIDRVSTSFECTLVCMTQSRLSGILRP